MKQLFSERLRLLPVLLAGTTMLLAFPARSADVTWDGGTSGTGVFWRTAANWDPDGVPTAADRAIFGSLGSSTIFQINLGAAGGLQPVGAIVLDAGRTTSVTLRNQTNSTLAGALVLHGVGGTLLRNEASAGSLVISNGVNNLSTNRMDVMLAASGEIYVANLREIILGSAITETNGAQGFTKTGPGSLFLRSVTPSTFTGPVTNAEGRIRFNANATLGDGTGTLYMAGGELVSTATRAGVPIDNPIVLLADAYIYPDSGTVSERVFPLGGPIAGATGTLYVGNQSTTVGNIFTLRLLAGGYTLNRPIEIGTIADTVGAFKQVEFFNAASNGVLTVSSVISGDGGVRRGNNAGGVVVLTANNTYSGGTAIVGGTLLANNTSGSALGIGPVTVTNTGILGGSGFITAATAVDAGGTISPGATTNGVGNLTFNDLTLNESARLLVHINAATGTPGTAWDVITVNGTWTDAATAINPVTVRLDSLGATPTGWNPGVSRTWKIIDGGSASGFDATHFALDTSAFTGTIQGVFSFDVVSGDLFLTYTPAADIVIHVPSGTQTQGQAGYPWLTGTFGVLKVGAGEAVFTNAANDYAGITKIHAGTASISVHALNGSGAFGAATSALLLGDTSGTSNAALNIVTDGVTNGRNITVQSGSTGTKTVGTSLTNGTVYYTGDITLQDDVRLTVPGGGTAYFGGGISGTFDVIKTGGGKAILDGNNTYSGRARVLGGTLSFDAIAKLNPAPPAPVDGLTILDGGTLEYTGGSTVDLSVNRRFTLEAGGGTFLLTNGAFYINASVAGPGALIKEGGSQLRLTNPTNTYAGGTFLNAGDLGVDDDGHLGTGTIYLNGGTLTSVANRSTTPANIITNPIVLNGDSVIRSSGGTANSQRLMVFQPASLTTPGGSLTITNGATATNNLFDVRIYAGGFTFTRPLTLDNGTAFSNVARLFLGNTADTAPQIFSGVISGNGVLRRTTETLTNGGVTILTAANTLTGRVEVAAGTLLVNNTTGSGTGSGNVILGANGILGGTGSIGGPVFGSGTVAPGVSAGILTFNGGVNLSTNGTYRWELAAHSTNHPGTDYDVIALQGGNLVLGGSSRLELVFTNSATNPDSGNPFWNSPRQWTVVAVGGSGANPGPTAFTTLSNATFTAGYFTNYADGGGNIVLAYVPTAAPPPPPPVISSTIAGAGTASATISFTSTNGATYTVEAKTNLLQPTWTFLGTVNATGPTSTFTDTNGPFPQRFYRVTSP
jgi:autotransporter-associated beta strand protein